MLEYTQQLSYPRYQIYYDLIERCIKKENILNAAQTHLLHCHNTESKLVIIYQSKSVVALLLQTDVKEP